MYRPKSGTLSILERAQGQLSGKRFGKKSAPSAYQKDEPGDEEDELQAYLNQLQERTSKQPFRTNDGDSDESYQPVAHSTPLKSGSQFLKSSRKAQETASHQGPDSGQSMPTRPSTRAERHNNGDLHDVSDGISSVDLSEQVSHEPKLPESRAGQSSQNFLKAGAKLRDDSYGPIMTRKPEGSPFVPKLKKSTAFERIMSNLISDEEDVEELIKDADSPRRIEVPDKPKLVPPADVDVDTSESVASFSDEEEAPSPEVTGSGQENIFQAQDLKLLGRNDTKDDVASNIFNKSDEKPFKRGGATKGISDNVFTRLDVDDMHTKVKPAPEVDVVVEEVQSDTETEIKTETATETSLRPPDRIPQRSDEETDVDVSLSSSITSQPSAGSKNYSESVSKRTVSESSVSQRSSPGPISDSQKSDTVSISMKSKSQVSESEQSRDLSKSSEDLSKSLRSDRSTAGSTRNTRSAPSQSSYSEDFTSDTNRSAASPRSGGSSTQSSLATVKHSPTPPATPAPHQRKSRPRKIHVTDTGVQTTDHLHGHWIFDRTSSGQTIDVTELLKEYKTTAVPPEALQAVSSVDYSTMLLHQTMKLQFQQTQQSIQQMQHVHQSLLESVQSDYKYTTLEDTKAYIQQQREKRKERDTS